MCQDLIENEKRESVGGIEQLNKKEIMTFEEKEKYKYLRILGVDIIKQAGMNEKILKKRVPPKNKKVS